MQRHEYPNKDNLWMEEEDTFQNSFAQIPIPNNSHVVLRIHVVRGRNISVGLSDWVDTPDAQLYLSCTSSFSEKGYKTEVKRNTVNPEWNEHFTFVIAKEEQFDESNQSVQIEAKLYDVDRFGPDDYIGKVGVDLSGLKIDSEKEITLSFEKHGEVDITVKKEIKRNLDLRRSYSLCDEEITYRKKRKFKVMEALQHVLGEDGPRNLSETPTISIATSGGGYRAMMASAGFIEGMFELKLFDTLTYWASLSGSSWYMAMAYLKQALQSHESLVSFNNELRSLCEKHLLNCLINPMFIKAYLEERSRTSEHDRPITLVNLYSFILGWTFFGLEHINRGFSETKRSVTEATLPFQMMTAVHVRDNMPLSAFKVGIEMNAFEISAPLYGVHIPTDLYNSEWSHGILLRKLGELPVHYHMGTAGSVFAILAQAALKKTNVNAGTASTNESGDGEVLEKEALKEMSTHIHNGSDNVVEEIVRESEDEQQEVKRAASILNFNYNLPDQVSYSLDPFLQKTSEGEPNKGFKRDITCDSKTIKLVDAGLSCNVPTEHVLRPQRTTDILIVLEAAMHKDQQLDFTTLLTAADQARQEGLKFPKFSKEKLLADKFKELYVIEDEDGDPDCPVVLWFTLSTRKFCNVEDYTPIHGRPAVSDEGEPFNSFPGSFAEIYHTYRLGSSPLIFDRLRELSHFNLVENKNILLRKIVARIHLKRVKCL